MQSVGSSATRGTAVISDRLARPAYSVASISTPAAQARRELAKQTPAGVPSDAPRVTTRTTIETHETRSTHIDTKLPVTVEQVAAANAYRAQQRSSLDNDQRTRGAIDIRV